MKKTTLIICCSLLALCTAVIGAFAYFSDSVTASVEGDIGTVDIELVDTEPSIAGKQALELTNKNKVFPGAEHFPYDPSIVNENLPSHRLYFHVHNKGMKSVRTRNIIDIIVTSAPNADGQTRNLDPTKFSLFEKSSVAPDPPAGKASGRSGRCHAKCRILRRACGKGPPAPGDGRCAARRRCRRCGWSAPSDRGISGPAGCSSAPGCRPGGSRPCRSRRCPSPRLRRSFPRCRGCSPACR